MQYGRVENLRSATRTGNNNQARSWNENEENEEMEKKKKKRKRISTCENPIPKTLKIEVLQNTTAREHENAIRSKERR